MKPTIDQVECIDALITFAHSNNTEIAFAAPAGCGKTFCISRFIERITDEYPNFDIVVCSPTHKALNILSKDKPSEFVDYMTIYKLLGLVPINFADTKKLTKKGKSALKNYDIVIVDEASMIPTIVLEFIEQQNKKTKFIYVGDVFQLPPVNEVNSPALNIPNVITLNKLIRPSEGLMPLCHFIRQCVKDSRIPTEVDFTQFDGIDCITVLSKPDFNNEIRLTFSSIDETNLDSARVIAYTNKAVDSYNSLVRTVKGLDPLQRYYPNELLVTKEPITVLMTVDDYVDVSKPRPPETDSILLPIATELRVISVETGTTVTVKIDGIEEPFYRFKLHCEVLDSGEEISFFIPQDFEHYENLCRRSVANVKRELLTDSFNKSLWDKHYRLKETVCTPQPLYALTSHGSQGSGFNTVFVDVSDILRITSFGSVDTALRSLYVAVTRAKEKVFLTY